MVLKIHIVRTADGVDFPLPTYTSRYHCALNLQAAVSSPVRINAQERVRIPIGFAMAIPDGLCGQIISHREFAMNSGVVVMDAPSIIHPADREAIFVLLKNDSGKPIVIKRGDTIAQMILTPVVQTAWNEIQIEEKQRTKPSEMSDLVLEEVKEEDSGKSLKASPKRKKVSIRERSTHE